MNLNETIQVPNGRDLDDPVKMFVRESGDDDNDGLSQSTAKRTIQAALDDSRPHLDPETPLTINLGSGSFGPFTTDGRAVSHLLVESSEGATITDGDPAVTVSQCFVELDGVTVDASATSPAAVLTTNGGVLRSRSVDYFNDAGFALWCRNGGFTFVQDCTIEGDGCLSVISGRGNVQDSTLRSLSNESAFKSWDTAQLFSTNNTIINDTGGGGFAAYVRKNGTMKSQGDEFQDWASAFDIGDEGFVQINQDITYSNTPDRARTRSGSSLRDESKASVENLHSVPTFDGEPEVSDIRFSEGVIVFDTSAGALKVFDGSAWVTL